MDKITEEEYDKILDNLYESGASDLESWWNYNSDILVNIPKDYLRKIINDRKDPEKLLEEYDRLFKSLSWEDRLDILKNGIYNAWNTNNKTIQRMILINDLFDVAAKSLPIILAII